MNRSILALARRPQHRRVAKTVAISCNQLPIPFTNRLPQHRAHHQLLPTRELLCQATTPLLPAAMHRSKFATNQLPVVAAACNPLPFSCQLAARSLFLVKSAANLYKRTGSNRTPPETTTDTHSARRPATKDGEGKSFRAYPT